MLTVCHAKGIGHGDIKPDNVFIDLENCQRMTYVLDWGLAVKHAPGMPPPPPPKNPPPHFQEVVQELAGTCWEFCGFFCSPKRPRGFCFWSAKLCAACCSPGMQLCTLQLAVHLLRPQIVLHLQECKGRLCNVAVACRVHQKQLGLIHAVALGCMHAAGHTVSCGQLLAASWLAVLLALTHGLLLGLSCDCCFSQCCGLAFLI